MSRDIAHDLSKKLQTEIGQVIERNLAVAKVVLQPADVFIMMMEASTFLVLSTATTIAANAGDDAGRPVLFDETVETIAAFVGAARARSLSAASANARAQA